MATTIKVENYQNIANFYANAQKQIAGVSDYYYDAAYEIVMLQVIYPELDLLSPFWTAYIAARSIYLSPPQAVVAAVRTLHNHILSRARTTAGNLFSEIDNWLDADFTFGVNTAGEAVGREDDVDTSIQVPEEFAVLSDLSGHTVDAALRTA